MKIKIIILILFCIIGFLYGRWAKEIADKVNKPVKIECDGGVCTPPEEWEDGRDK